MRVSIVTISLNQGEFLEQALDSVAEQEYEDVEHIVIDAGSTDRSTEILSRRTSDLAFWCSEPDAGPAAGLNKGFARATGVIYGYINADDCFLPGAIQTVVDAFDRWPEADVIFGHGWLMDRNGKGIRRIFSDRWEVGRYVAGACVVVQQATFFRASAFERIGGFNERNRWAWDGELLVELGLAGCRFRRIHKVIGGFRLHPGSITGSMQHAEAFRMERARLSASIRATGVRGYSSNHLLSLVEKRLGDPVISLLKMLEAGKSLLRTGTFFGGSLER